MNSNARTKSNGSGLYWATGGMALACYYKDTCYRNLIFSIQSDEVVVGSNTKDDVFLDNRNWEEPACIYNLKI